MDNCVADIRENRTVVSKTNKGMKDLEENNRARYGAQSKILAEFVSTFTENWGRAPLTDEIVGHAQELSDQIDEDMLQKYLEMYTLQVNNRV